ncbi:adenylate/guanylate cyclase domain-containing protein [Williamsia muralis]|jgi:adenylate cyclase|uniref:Adenylate cyclase n=1 Tax=Williamsia marianensis TaxID=85044 RepID=A0A315S3D3_WILMA|nr:MULTISPECIES: adenylate/guanylate cyclase domain-containing protein [Williamsia]PVY29015.1 adenylate cyclase [Williamsia marianensis]RKR93969.1 adenylate cyclase [Williamsia muralis]
MRLWRRESDYGSILLGSTQDSIHKKRIRIQLLISVGVLTANAIGAGMVILLVTIGIPEPSVLQSGLWWVNFIVVPVYVSLAFLIGLWVGTTRVLRRLRWALRDEPPTAAQARAALKAPALLTRLQAALWVVAGILFTTAYGVYDAALIPKIAFVVGLSAAVVCSIAYLLTEFSLRPVAAQALEAGHVRAARRGSLRTRGMLTWSVGSGIPIVGVMLVVIFGLFRDDTTKVDIFIAVTVLSATALFTGSILNFLSMDSIVAPIRTVRQGMSRVRSGDNDVRVVVFDGTELGDLQAGFNSMVAGLGERERLRDLFGRHVGKEVAEAALAQDPELGGSEQTVAVLFIDVIGSTTLAATRPPADVVNILNQFFAVVVSTVEKHDGLVNKFQGDAVLAVFGAPIGLSDSAASALVAAREISEELAIKVPQLQAGIGVAYGPVVAGNVGAIQRFEYTVIGDAVNEAARLSELAKKDPGRPLSSGRAVEAASKSEASQWHHQDSTVLRGRSEATEVYATQSSAD